jgi:hypothetical protein
MNRAVNWACWPFDCVTGTGNVYVPFALVIVLALSD